METRRRWFTRRQVCKLLGMDGRTFRNLVEAGLFPRGVRRGKQQLVWSREDIEAMVWLEMHRHRLRPTSPTDVADV